jgi:hypothetical protein
MIGFERADVAAIVASTTDERITRPALAWLAAFDLARWLGFSDETAPIQAAGAWDIAVDELAAATALEIVGVN